ncbi:rhomboid family intramembrane serine protease [Sinomicrobium weinanense]|uniref:Rhomboid family intramembrane serine protease n=1 Tax=Sinomicrobium weinanense TaxID=2842200 RepID=A0A926Q1V6_9FLAO|nr:rhomboid family intramembrane serine protease [Sinomicrobium weinanense]MBC9796057.1 rhomboid family intramembrane serine protease [Sinomicrobium weinanense]MBU3123124.1 rhomboid family intramembrane serine protease [Sinomicrobium weinanense]
MGISNDIKYKYTTLNVGEKLIVINVLVYILNILLIFLFQLSPDFFMRWFELPKSLDHFIVQPWSIVTYAFFHGSFSHIFWNMILLYFSGRIFLNLFGGRRFLNVYFLGAIAGGFIFMLSYNLFPAFLGINTSLIGASAAVMAILIFICTYMPNQEVRLFFLFNIKLWYIGVFVVLIDLVQIPINNAGGHLAHLGGALLGYVYARKLYEGKDIGSGFEKMVSAVVNLFKRKPQAPLKTVHRNRKATTSVKRPNTDKSDHQQKIDDILDKISKSGYESLTKEEKDFLFQAGKE